MSKLANGLLSSLLNTGVAFASTVSAINADGLGIYDDSGNLGVFVKDGGNVGIGTSSPSSKLSVVNGYYADNILRIDATDNNAEFFSIGVKSGYVMLTAGYVGSGDTAMVFRTSPTTEIEAMRLDKRGYLGIGTATPNTSLHFNGGLTGKITTVNVATYDLLITDNILAVTYPATGAVTSFTLPSAQCVDGRIIHIADTSGLAGTNNITIDTEGSEKINGQDTNVINSNYGARTIFASNSNWFLL